jgi:hypothetical protein
MFLAYVTALGLSSYGFITFMKLPSAVKTVQSARPTQVIGGYFVLVAALFYSLWLSEILPALAGGFTPGTLKKAGLFTNPVHVIDLSFFLPGIFITGLMLLRHRPIALKLTPVLLVFFILMDITIAVIALVQGNNDLASYILASTMAVLTLGSGLMLSWLMSRSTG